MGKYLGLLKGISLPPDIESKLSILDLQVEQMEIEIKINELQREHETLRTKEADETRRLNRSERQQEAPRFAARVRMRPDDPTDDEAAVLKLMQPPGRQMDVNTIAQLMRKDLTTIKKHLNELQRKDCIHKSARSSVQGVRAPSSTYSLTPKGVMVFIDHNRAE
jgi:hypothetical protein